MDEFRVAIPLAPVRAAPSYSAMYTSEALYGEKVSLLKAKGDWVFISQQQDGYQGYIHAGALQSCETQEGKSIYSPTHWISQSSTLLFKNADLKSPVIHRIPFASELSLTTLPDSSFSQTSCGFFVWSDHCLPVNKPINIDPLTLAKDYFLGMPYLWGGRSPAGADCSGLIQLLARSQGLSIPRDSGDQESFLKHQIPWDKRQSMDIVYWPGHTGILLDANTLLHATAFSLSCIIEPLADVVLRAGEASSVRRLFTFS